MHQLVQQGVAVMNPCRISLQKSIDNPLNFSILLIHTQRAGLDVIIARYNGDHGLHINKRTGEKIRGPHIHMITEEHQRHGGKPEGFATATCEYKTFDEALATFISDMNIREHGSYKMPNLRKWA